MKNSLFILLLTAPVGLIAQTGTKALSADTFRITGRLKNIKAIWVYLVHTDNGRQIIDSAKTVNGAYMFSGALTGDQPASLLDIRYVRGEVIPPRHFAGVFLSPGALSIVHIDSFSNTIVTGSLPNTQFRKVQQEIKPYKNKQEALLTRYKAAGESKDMAALTAIKQQLESIDEEIKEKVFLPFIRQNPNSRLSLYLLQIYAGRDIDVYKVKPLFDGLSGTIRHSKTGVAFDQRMASEGSTAIGAQATDFTQNDIHGKPVKLSSFRGKYVLLDFWASWCAPCRAENPNLVRAYAEYRSRGFEILSVSLDRAEDKAGWLKAISDDHLTWTQVSDLQYVNNAAARQYGVRAIPQNFLIDPKGSIVAKGLRGEALEKKLDEIYGE